MVGEIDLSVIEELLKKEEIMNEDLTALIQMFGNNCKKETFYNYLKTLKFSKDVERDIYRRFIDTGETGYTGRGRAVIKGLDESQLKVVKNFLSSISKAETKEEIKTACEEYRKKEIPQVTRGIYSPWLHYLKPKICPMIAGPIATFFKNLGFGENTSYSDLIEIFERLKSSVGEEDLGLIDQFFWNEKRRNSIIKYKSTIMSLLENKKQIILYGPPGTGKTFITKKIAVNFIK